MAPILSPIQLAQQSEPVGYKTLYPTLSVYIKRTLKNGSLAEWHGTVLEVNRLGRQVLKFNIINYWEAGQRKLAQSNKTKEILCDKSVRLFLINEQRKVQANEDLLREFAAKRKAAQANRQALTDARGVMETNYTLLGLTTSVTREEFNKVKRKIYAQWHPDRAELQAKQAGGIPAEAFILKAKTYTDALAEVDHFLRAKEKRYLIQA